MTFAADTIKSPAGKMAPQIVRFFENLAKLDRGDLAVLKRNTGNLISQSRQAMGLFYRLLPHEVANSRDEELYFLVATLYGYNHEFAEEGDFGTTMHRVKIAREGSAEETGSLSPIDRRMAILLDSELDLADGFRPGGGEASYRLRQCVKLAAGARVGINWPLLLKDLTQWSHPDKKVRKRWARSYYGAVAPKDAAAE
jgi:CRISPR system Cascade subunit CasB